jgi:ATP-binding cassette subfamily F protein uup
MSHLISCQSASKRFGSKPLFENLTFAIGEGERIGLIGPNGSGKSTLVQILAGLIPPDEGTVAHRKQLRLGYVPQEPSFASATNALAVVMDAIGEQPGEDYEKESRAIVTLGRVGFASYDVEAETLSGGWRKRLAIARELVREPDVLLLDEPTNHLDLDGIVWLEKLLMAASFSSVVVSHDRYFLENFATDMAEINPVYPDGLFRVHGDYAEFLLKREEFLHAQLKEREALENKVRREVEWLRRGAKARTTKSKARIDNAERMIEDLQDIKSRTVERAADIDFTASGRKTKRLLAGERVSKELGGKPLFRDLDLVLRPGTRLGLVGPNGSGKTTLLRVLADEVAIDSGTIERADLLRIVYFDQFRARLDPEVSLRRALAPDADTVLYRDRPIHVAGWAKRFLFRAEQLDVPVSRLSGGERARAVIARLMLQPADLLLLDEPTNDLDIPTLEVLEDSLMEFTGAIVLVTHDRYMLDRVSTQVLGLDGGGGWGLFADYSQWEDWRLEQQRQPAMRSEAAPSALSQPATAAPRKKLSYMEAREYDGIEDRIHEAEALLAALQADIQSPGVTSDPARLQQTYEKMQGAQSEVDRLYERWAELEAKIG